MDAEVPYPSIEHDDVPDLFPTTSTKTQDNRANTQDRKSLGTAANIPLPPSSPLKSPRKTPRLQRQTSSLGSPVSETPSYRTARSSPSNNDWRSATPSLNMKRSNSNLAANGRREITPSRQSGVRRISSNQIKTVPPSATLKLPQEPEKKRIVTAGTIARDYFTKELAHTSTAPACGTVIIVHDSCYGHRFSRPRTSRAALSTIVERPERILATMLGVSAAYVRLGDRHSEGRYGPRPDRDPTDVARPPFSIRKTTRFVALNHPAVTHVHGAKWMEELQILCDSAEGKLALNGKELVRPIGYGKDESGVSLPKLHEGDLYLCAESLDALQGCLGGVCDAVDTVFSPGETTRAFVCIRPPGHHCSSNFPSGFCWLNNVHVGIAHAAITYGLTHAAIIDFDLHHGDGSQTITWDHNRKAQTLQKNAAAHKKTPIGYFSLHDINSYPCEMGDEDKVRNASLCIENAHGQSIWNVHLESWRNLEEFWKLYETRYVALLKKTKIFLRHHTARLNSAANGPHAKAAIFLSAGFDASEWEGAGMQRHKVNVPTDFYARFTADVVNMAEEEGLGVDGRVISVLEGGYSDRALTSGVLSHVCGLTHGQAQVVPVNGNATSNGVKVEIPSHGSKPKGILETDQGRAYDIDWWASHNLEALESKANPDTFVPVKKAKEKQAGDYSAPTEASTARMTDTARERRSLSSQFGQRLNLEPEPIQPPPEVDWATAAFELSRLIIPSERQTLSCRHEELNAEATRARKERQSLMALPAAEDEKRELRARKAKPALFEAAPVRARSKSRESKRRTTVASIADLLDPEMKQESGGEAQASARPRRRSSAASSMMSAFEGLQMNDRRSAQPSQAGSDPTDSRASSVVAGKAPKPPVVKKTRVAGNARAPAKPRASPKKVAPVAPPVPRVPSAFYSDPNGDVAMTEVTTDEHRSSQAGIRTGGSVVRAEEMDKLTGGMNKLKIKLKVPSPEENATRERKALEKAQAKPKAVRKPPIPKAAKVPKPTATNTAKTPTAINQQIEAREGAFYVANTAPETSAPIESKTEAKNKAASIQHTASVTDPASGASPPDTWAAEEVSDRPPVVPPTVASFDTVRKGPHADDATSPVLANPPRPATFSNVSFSATTPTPQLQAAVTSTAPADQNTPPSVAFIGSTPFGAVKRTKADLPIFTSSSPIPFSSAGSDPEIEKEEQSIWDVPETPQQPR